MFEKLFNAISLLGQWGYLILFLAAFLESSAFLGLLVPGETIVVLAGFLSSQGSLDIGDCLWVIALGAVLGDSVGYSLGKMFGTGYFEKHERLLFLKRKHIEKTNEYFRRHGGKTIFFGRFIGLLRAMAPFVAGMAKMRYRVFAAYNVAGGILWSVSFTLLGYFFGQSWQLIEKWSGRAGVFIVFMLLIIAAFAYLYRLIVKKQKEIYGWFEDKANAVINNPRINLFLVRHPGLVNFVKERLSPQSYLGLHLTIGLAVSAIFVWILAGITEDVLTGDPFVAVDYWVMNHVLYFKTPAVTQFMLVCSFLGGIIMIMACSLGVTAFLVLRRRVDYLTTYLSAIIGGSILVFFLKQIIHRPRPIIESSFAKAAAGWSFPSSSTMLSMISYGMIAYILVRNTGSWRRQALVVTAAGFIVFLIGLSRIYLQLDYLSDVAAGYAGGLFWLSMCITGFAVYRKNATHEQI